MPVSVVPYDPAWPLRFQEEAERLRRAFGAALTAVHHIGSTAVPGLAAKPIIDLLGETRDLSEIDSAGPSLVRLGYEVMGEFGIPGRRYFRRSDASGARTHHLHVFEAASADVMRHLAFRDYLRAHPAARAAYAELKLRLVRAGLDWDGYMDGKADFVTTAERAALDWYRAGGSA